MLKKADLGSPVTMISSIGLQDDKFQEVAQSHNVTVLSPTSVVYNWLPFEPKRIPTLPLPSKPAVEFQVNVAVETSQAVLMFHWDIVPVFIELIW